MTEKRLVLTFGEHAFRGRAVDLVVEEPRTANGRLDPKRMTMTFEGTMLIPDKDYTAFLGALEQQDRAAVLCDEVMAAYAGLVCATVRWVHLT